jgi:arginine decarboxylase
VLDVRGTGRTGYEIADELRRSYDVHVELPMQATIVFVVGLGDTAAALRRLAGDVEEVVLRLSEPGATAPIVPPAASLGYEVAVSPRDAFLGEAERVDVDAAVGRISCESIASYPPGVPALLPGERISAETIAYLRELADSGARLHGASDPAFRTINVLVEP